MSSSPRTKLVYLAPTIAELNHEKRRRPIPISRRSARFREHASHHNHPYKEVERISSIEEVPKEKTLDKVISPLQTSNTLLNQTQSQDAISTATSDVESLSAGRKVPLQTLPEESTLELVNYFASKEASDSVSDHGSITKRKKVNDSYSTNLDQDENREEPISPAKKNLQNSIPPVSKAEYLRLGRARAVGLQRHNKRKAIIFPAPLRITQSKTVLTDQRPGPRPLTMTRADRSIAEGFIGGATTVESIPPPPTHLFTLSSITSIYNLLSSPNNYLSSHQGGSQHETSLKFNILALVIRVQGLESCPDWRAGGGKMMDRCEIIVKDFSDCAMKVVLEGNCATRWASAKSSQSLVAEQESSMYSHEMNPFDASINAANDTSTFANGSKLEMQRLTKLFPLRPGDVIVLFRLVLSRPKKKKLPTKEEKNTGPTSVFATASPRWEPQIELCWRNDIQSDADQHRNFDQSLTAFDARCKAIFRLAKAWHV